MQIWSNFNPEAIVTHLHKACHKSENSVSRYLAKAPWKEFFPIDILLQILILIYLF